jgi:UPF0716 protein FxsA
LEVASILIVGRLIGTLATIGAVLAGAVVGGLILAKLGRAFFTDLDRALKSGEAPEGPVMRAVCLLGAGILFLTPGFFSDLLALALLIPGSRALLAPMVWKRMSWTGRAPFVRQPRWTGTGRSNTGPSHSSTILDGEYKDVTNDKDPTGLPPRREE